MSPLDALIDIEVGRGLYRQIPIWLDFYTLTQLRMTAVVPQRWPAHPGYVQGLCVHPDVIEAFFNLGAVRYKRDQLRLTTALSAQQRKTSKTRAINTPQR